MFKKLYVWGPFADFWKFACELVFVVIIQYSIPKIPRKLYRFSIFRANFVEYTWFWLCTLCNFLNTLIKGRNSNSFVDTFAIFAAKFGWWPICQFLTAVERTFFEHFWGYISRVTRTFYKWASPIFHFCGNFSSYNLCMRWFLCHSMHLYSEYLIYRNLPYIFRNFHRYCRSIVGVLCWFLLLGFAGIQDVPELWVYIYFLVTLIIK